MLFWGDTGSVVMLVRHQGQHWGWINATNTAKWVYEPQPHADAPPEVCNGQFPISGSLPPTPTFTPQPTVTGTPPTATPTPTITPTPSAAQIPGLLLEYGVYVLDQTGTPNQSDMQAVYDGVVEIGLAFSLFSTVYSDPKQAFRAIMLEDQSPQSMDATDMLIVVLIENRSSPPAVCQTYNRRGDPNTYPAQTDPSSAFLSQTAISLVTNPSNTNGSQEHRAYISCHPNVILSEYTVVHEMGHIFDNGSSLALQSSIEATDLVSINNVAQSFPIEDANNRIVMGRTSSPTSGTVWGRGTRGWGSGPASNYTTQPPSKNITDFQQNPPPYPGTDDFHETAADLFLNWVYRTVLNNPSATVTGFRNISWSPISDPDLNNMQCLSGCNDWRKVMTVNFCKKGWCALSF
jgi:hypothetical protein